MVSMEGLPELARDSHLDTRMTPDYCVHFFVEAPTVTRREVWKRARRIGAGGFGTVWLETCVEGQASGTDTQRAVKVLPLPDEQAQAAIIQCGRELEAFAKFSQRKYSRCFVKSSGWYEHASSICICLEYLPLGDLQAFIHKRADPRLPEAEAKQVVSQVLDGLVFMHAEGFAHRDLKPSNILIKSHGPDDWWVKLSDFGLSRRTEVTRAATAIQGTPGFMAPELWGFLANDHPPGIGMWRSADLWSLGEIAFQLVTAGQRSQTLGHWRKLQKAMVSAEMVDFVTALMLADYTQRPSTETASADRWFTEPKTASLVLPINVRFNSSQELSSGNSSIFDRTGSGPEYRAWSTVTSAPEISFQDPASVNVALMSWGGSASDAIAVSDTIRPVQNSLDQGQSSAIIEPNLSEPMIPSFSMLSTVAFSDTSSPLCTPPRTPIHMPVGSDWEESESDLAASAQQALATGTYWYSDFPNTPHNSSSHSEEELHKPQRLTTKVLTTAIIEALTTSSANMIAQISYITALKGIEPGSHQIVFSPDSKTIATTSADNSVSLWSMQKQTLIRTIEDTGKYVSFSPNSQQIAAVKQAGAACILDASLERSDAGQRVMFRAISEEACCVTFSPTGDQMVVGTSQGNLIVWDTIKVKMLKRIKAHSKAVVWVAYYPNPRQGEKYDILGGDADGCFRFWKHEVRPILSDRWVSVESWETKGKDKIGLKVASGISAAAASKSFARLAVAMLDGSIAVWYNGEGGHWIEGLSRESVLKGHNEGIDAMDFSPDSKLLASASSGSIKVWQVRGALPVATMRAPGSGMPRSVTFSSDSIYLAATSSDGMVRLWDVEKLQDLSDAQDHLDRASFVAVSPDRRYMASVTRELRTKVINKGVYDFYKRESFKRQRLPVDTDVATLMIWDVATAKPITLIFGHEAEILSVSFSEDSKRIGSISADHVLRIWNVETGQCLDTIVSRTEGVDTMPCAALSAGLRYCAAVFRYHFAEKQKLRIGGYVRAQRSGFAISLCDIRLDAEPSGEPHPCKALAGTIKNGDILAIAFSPDSKKLAAVDQNNNIILWDTASGAMTACLSDFAQTPPRGRGPFKPRDGYTRHFAYYREHMRRVGSPALQFVSSGTRLAFFSGLSAARFWNVEGGGQLLRRIGSSNVSSGNSSKKKKEEEANSEGKSTTDDGKHGNAFTYCSYSIPLAASPDGTRCVAALAAGQQLALWDVGTGEPVVVLGEYAQISDVSHVAFSPDAQWLVTASDEDMVVRDAATGRRHTEITVGVSWPLRMVAFWPDSRYLVSGCHKGTLQFWDVESGAMVKTFEGHTGRRAFAI